MFPYLRFRYRRQLRRARRGVASFRRRSNAYIDAHLMGKGPQLRRVRRFLAVWLTVAAFGVFSLAGQIQALERAGSRPTGVAGGTYSEAAVGTVDAMNPLVPQSAAAGDVNRLIFSGLTRYDARGKLVGDLAERWSVSRDGRTYTFTLRRGVTWHDGQPFDAGDVAFTIAAIKNPDTRSPLASSWQDIDAEAVDPYTVRFTLPNPLASFADSTTLAIVPRHLLESVDPSRMRQAGFNQEPVGTGPFKLATFAPSAREITLDANPDYYRGQPKLEHFTFRYYDSAAAALDAYARRQVTSPGAIPAGAAARTATQSGLVPTAYPLPQEVAVFFNTANGLMSDRTLRDILSRSLDRTALAKDAAGTRQPATQPLLPGMTGYTDRSAPGPLSLDAAGAALDAAGWTAGGSRDYVRQKAGQRLDLQLVTLKGGSLEATAELVVTQWRRLGVDASVKAVDAEQLQQTYMRPRNFQAVLYGINLGGDPDVYSFWHSTQAKDPGVNLSGYASDTADRALEAGRLTTDPATRAARYATFLESWNADMPAAVLYESSYTYGRPETLRGLGQGRLIMPSDRFTDVERWTIRSGYEPAYPRP